MLASTRRSPARRPGKVVAVTALLLVFLTGMVAFSIDMGQVAATRTELQRAADAAALAGAALLAVAPGETHDEAEVRAEVRKYVSLNAGLSVRDEDIVLVRHDPNANPVERIVTTLTGGARPNGVRVTVRRDGRANGPLGMYFAPVIGVRTIDVAATATASIQQASGIMPYAPFIPYVLKDTWFDYATGKPGAFAPGYATQDAMTVSPEGRLSAGADGRREILLYSDRQTAPGNYGSIDVGTRSNGTPELRRQILYGPNEADFAHPDFRDKVAADGALYAPFMGGGDPGISAGVRPEFESIVGKTRIVPLYRSAVGTGNNVTYDVVGFVSVVITSVKLTGNPKEIWCQPTSTVSYYVTAGGGTDGVAMPGVYTRPRLVVPSR